MDAIKRIYLACRATIAELPLSNYLIAPGILLACVAIIFYSGGDGDRYRGVLANAYYIVDPEISAVLVASTGWLAATIISGSIFSRYFKDENRAVRQLSLPLANGERFSAMVLVNWLYVSVISFLPLVLLVVLFYFVRPENVLMAPPFENVHWYLIGPLAHLVTMAFWLFPTVAYAKKGGFIIVGIIVGFIVYMTNTRSDLADVILLDHTPTVFEATDVVGLNEYGFLNERLTEVPFEIPSLQYLQIILLAIVVVLMMFAAYLALTRKTA